MWALPAADEIVRCADFTRQLAVDPAGTAFRADLVVAAEVPLPWPKPVFAHPLLAGVESMPSDAPQPTRVLAAVPELERGELTVVAYRRSPATSIMRRTEWRTDAGGLAPTIAEVVAGSEPADALRVHEQGPNAEVWICTQGSHDMCCGSDGVRLVQDLAGQWDDVIIRRVSHTGGHRFAPTGITFPDGRMWAYLAPGAVDTALRRSGDPAVLAPYCRGWVGTEQGPAQVAERAVFATTGWAWEAAPRWADVVGVDGDVTTVEVAAGEGRLATWTVSVRVSREVATISCRVPGGLPAKPGVEYEVVEIVG